MTTKNNIGALVTAAITYGTISTSKAEELSVDGVVETSGGYAHGSGLATTVDAIGKLTVADHLMFFERYRGTGEWNEESGLSTSEFSIQNIRFPNLPYGLGVVLERQQSDAWNDLRIGMQHTWQDGALSTYALGTVGETFAEGVIFARYQRDVADNILFAQLEAVADISYKGDFLFATERQRFGIQKNVYSLAIAGDFVQTNAQKLDYQATFGLASALQF